MTIVGKAKQCSRLWYQQYTDERSWNWHDLPMSGHLGIRKTYEFYNIFFGLASKEKWQSGAKCATLAN